MAQDWTEIRWVSGSVLDGTQHLTFSEHALRGAVEYLRETEPGSLEPDGPLAFDQRLVGPTGIPEDARAEAEWATQLEMLQTKMRGEYSARELDVAVRTLIGAIRRCKAMT